MTALAGFLALPRWVHIALACLLLVAVLFTLHRCSVADAVKADRATTEAKVSKTVIEADRAAERADEARQAEIRANDATMRKAIDDAVQKDPEGASRPAGPISRAAAEQLRKRQAGNIDATD